MTLSSTLLWPSQSFFVICTLKQTISCLCLGFELLSLPTVRGVSCWRPVHLEVCLVSVLLEMCPVGGIFSSLWFLKNAHFSRSEFQWSLNISVPDTPMLQQLHWDFQTSQFGLCCLFRGICLHVDCARNCLGRVFTSSSARYAAVKARDGPATGGG